MPSDGLLRRTSRSLRAVLGDPDLARLLAAWLSINAGKWAFLVANLVIAYEAGGAVAVAVMGLARYLTPTLLAPLAGLPTARWRPDRVLVGIHVLRTMAVGLAVLVVATGAPLELLYGAIALEAGAGAFTRPLHMALLPHVSRTPEELVAANVTSSAAEALGTFIGPAVAGFLLVTSGPFGSVLAVLAIYAAGIYPLAGLHVPVLGRADASLRAVGRQVVAGLRAVAEDAGPRMVLVGLGMQTFVRGLLIVLTVIAAIELLGMGDPGVGALNAAMGIGGLVGALLAAALTGRPRLIPPFALALACWGAPIAIVGLVSEPIVALAAMVVVGTSNAVLDVAGFTLIQRLTPNDRRVALLGLVDSVANGGVAAGGVVAPVLVEVAGVQGALIATGLILPVTALALWPFLRRVDEAGTVDLHRVGRIRGLPLFAPLSLATVEHLAETLESVSFPAGGWLMREGEVGDRFVIVEAGEVDVIQGGVTLRRLGPGEGVGEIALVHDIPRTASVRAVDAVTAWALDRESFVSAVSGTPDSLRRATSIADERRLGDPGVDDAGGGATARTDGAS